MKIKILLIVLLLASCNLSENDTNNEKIPEESTTSTQISSELKLEITTTSTIVCFGDSVTSGYGIEEENSYPSLLQNRINIPVINSGVTGETSFEALNRINEDVLKHNPVITIVLFGANDFAGGSTPEEIKNSLLTIIDELTSVNSKVVLLQYFTDEMIENTDSIGDYQIGEELKEELRSINKMFKEIDSEREIILIKDIWSEVWGNEDYMYDLIHPNEAGAKVIAEKIYDRLEEILKYNNLLK